MRQSFSLYKFGRIKCGFRSCRHSRGANSNIAASHNHREFNGGSSCWPSCGGYWGGETRGGGGYNVPENEAFGRPAPPPTKTAEQKAAAVAVCEKFRDEQTTFVTTIYTANMGNCTAGNSTLLGYANQQLQLAFAQVAGVTGANCAVVLTQQFNDVSKVIDNRRNTCVVTANKD